VIFPLSSLSILISRQYPSFSGGASDIMNTNHESKPTYTQEIEKPGVEYNENEKTDAAHRAEAIMAESVEHNMTVLEAVKAYPMASFWAFVFSCTIVRYQYPNFSLIQQLTITDHGILRRLPHW
jgi:hypothetical protein